MQNEEIKEKFETLLLEFERQQSIDELSRTIDAPKQPKIPAWVGWLIPIVFGGIKSGVAQIKDELARDLALFGIDNTAEMVGLLTDNERNNLEQVQDWLSKNWERLAKDGGGLVLRLLDKHAPKNAKWGVIIEYLGKVLKEMDL